MRSPFNRFLRWTPILLLIGGCFVYGEWALRRLKPPEGVRTLEAFAAAMPAPQRVRRVTVNGEDYFVWIGELPPHMTFPSGPPCYIFDRSGKFVDWSRDVGDDHRLDVYFQSAPKSPPISVEEAIALSKNPPQTH